jgi:hypothetical protein
MTSIITGDIVHSQKSSPMIWLDVLKSELNVIGPNPLRWEIYRGDSFQAEVVDPLEALNRAIEIKAAVKCIKNIDVRMAIGIGDKTHSAENITESNGTAFVFSGERFEQLKKDKQNLAIASAWKDFDRDINLYIRLALLAMDNWSVNSAAVVNIALKNPDKLQKELGKMLGIKQNAISNRLKRAHLEEILELEKIYQTKIKTLL